MATSSRTTKSTSKSAKTTTKYVKKLSKKVGNGGVIALAIFLVLGVAIGLFVAMIMTSQDRFELDDTSVQTYTTSDTVKYEDTLTGVTLFEFGKDVSSDVKVTTTLPVDSDGNVIMTEGTYITTYTYITKLGKEIHRYQTVEIVEP